MATDNRVLGEIAAMTIDHRIPDLVDNFFQSNPLIVKLLQRDKVDVDGGEKIRQPVIYGQLNGGFYSDLDTFDVSRKETVTEMLFDWKQAYINITISGLESLKNAGAAKIRDQANYKMDNAQMTGADILGTAIYSDGSSYGGKAITGLRRAIDDGTTYTTYGGITRSSTRGTEGYAVRGNFDTTGGVFSLGLMNSTWSNAVVANEKPDYIATTQSIWNKWWDRVQPAQRFNAGDSRNQLANAGFDVIRHNGADVVVDQHCPAGHVYFLNCKWIKFITHSKRQWTFTGWKYPTNQDAMIGQLLWAGELVVQSPRLQAGISNVT